MVTTAHAKKERQGLRLEALPVHNAWASLVVLLLQKVLNGDRLHSNKGSGKKEAKKGVSNTSAISCDCVEQ